MDALRKIVIDYLTEQSNGICSSCGFRLRQPIVLRIGDSLKDTYVVHRICSSHIAVNERKHRARSLSGQSKSPQEIADALGVSKRTVFNYLKGE